MQLNISLNFYSNSRKKRFIIFALRQIFVTKFFLTSRTRDPLENLVVAQLVKIFVGALRSEIPSPYGV